MEIIAYPAVLTNRTGSYTLEKTLPEEYRSILNEVPLHGLDRDTLQVISLRDLVAVVVSRSVVRENQRPGVHSYMYVCTQKGFSEVMRYPERLLRLWEYMCKCGEELQPLTAWPNEILAGEPVQKQKWTPVLERIFHTVVNDLAGQRCCYLCGETELSEEEVVELLRKLPARLRGRVSFTLGYCQSCAHDKLQFIVRRKGDPSYRGKPSCVPYSGGEAPYHPAAEALLKLSQKKSAAVSNLADTDETFLHLADVFYQMEKAEKKQTVQKKYPDEAAILEKAGLCQVSKKKKTSGKKAEQSQEEGCAEQLPARREKPPRPGAIGGWLSAAAGLALLLAVFWGTEVTKIGDTTLYVTVRMTADQAVRYLAVFAAGLCLSLKRRRKRGE